MKIIIGFIFALLYNSFSHAAACCGGGSSSSKIITNDDQFQLSSSYSYSEIVVADVSPDGFWSLSNSNQKIQRLEFSFSAVFWDRYQSGIVIPVIKKSYLDYSYSGIGDAKTFIAYELITDWDYNPYKPKIILALNASFPFSKSPFESQNGGLDTFDTGFTSYGLSTHFIKHWNRLSAMLMYEAHNYLGKKINTDSFYGVIKPNQGTSFGFNFSYQIDKKNELNFLNIPFSAGFGLSNVFESAYNFDDHNSKNNLNSSSQEIKKNEAYTQFILSFSVDGNNNDSFSLNYLDQTLFGNPINTSLSRGLSISYTSHVLR